ncbi:P-loop containing nucleoside triphosphate hydrolase protein [Ascobolus immersus RN42]|uniref:P-loop containing nucleoside triphosphate hydrolase protein n=1 Tax=Ascobolus immersus RN42 TaxID=1160509 RepID=A0A3N4I9N2_ASCIM|nr:P-loop containing nucleoside triphosphate hydrolase protein [Ascobolus immersus RN42]
MASRLPFLQIKNATFHAHPPPHTSASQKLFPNLSLTIPNDSTERWCILSPPRPKSLFMQAIAGRLYPSPPNSIHFPSLLAAKIDPRDRGFRIVNFSGSGGGGNLVTKRPPGEFGYLGGRFESFELGEEEGITVGEWVGGAEPIEGLGLERLWDRRLLGLSNGEARRALLGREIRRGADGGGLFVDEPFVGLDVKSRGTISQFLEGLADSRKNPRTVMLGIRTGDAVPEWVSHVLQFSEDANIVYQGPRLDEHSKTEGSKRRVGRQPHITSSPTVTEPLISIKGLTIAHPTPSLPPLMDNFNLELGPGDSVRAIGPNGSGKSTFLAVLTADHPAAYASNIRYFGQTRLPEVGKPGVPIEKVQQHLGLVSPELNAIVPKWRNETSVKAIDVLLSGFSETGGVGGFTKPKGGLTDANVERVNEMKHHFAGVLPEDFNWEKSAFHELPAEYQRLVLLLRATARNPKVLLLDEAFSGMEERLREKCWEWLEGGWNNENGAMVVVSHVEEETPPNVRRWVSFGEEGWKEGTYE